MPFRCTGPAHAMTGAVMMCWRVDWNVQVLVVLAVARVGPVACFAGRVAHLMSSAEPLVVLRCKINAFEARHGIKTGEADGRAQALGTDDGHRRWAHAIDTEHAMERSSILRPTPGCPQPSIRCPLSSPHAFRYKR